MTGSKVVILGGGFGGVAAARTARALLDREHEIVLIDRKRRTYLCGAFPFLIIGQREPLKVSRSLGRLANRGIRYVEASATRIDASGRAVHTSVGVFEYDHLVLATGAEYDWAAVPGAAGAFSFYDIENAKRLRRRLRSLNSGRVAIAVSGMPYKCPPAPYEAAMVIDWMLRRRGVRKAVEIDVYSPEPAPLVVAGREAGRFLLNEFERRGIALHTGATVSEVAPDGRAAGFSNGDAVQADVIVTIPIHRMAPIVAESGLANGAQWLSAGQATLETATPGVYAVGDTNVVPMANGQGVPKAGVFASAEGEVAGANVAASITGAPPVRFDGKGSCFIAFSGTRAGMVEGNFLAEGQPRVNLRLPTPGGLRTKERFERDWRRFRI